MNWLLLVYIFRASLVARIFFIFIISVRVSIGVSIGVSVGVGVCIPPTVHVAVGVSVKI